MRQIDLGSDARKALSDKQVLEIGNWRIRESDTVEQRIARDEAVELARTIQGSQLRMQEIRKELSVLDEQLAPDFQSQVGMGSITVAIILAAYSHTDRVRYESAFAALAGVSPL